MPTPKDVTYQVINLAALLDEEDRERLSACSDFSWGDTDIAMVTIQNFIRVCDKRNLCITDDLRRMSKDVYWMDVYVDLNA
jgi:hypothetical protein